ncbi:MAG: UDP binding domain-containing protein, partial [Anaerolineae bacterium]|nr:UDP binding domain-containing protein [Anaerolineae bacterium]
LLPIPEALCGADCAVILADHAEFRALGPEAFQLMRRPVVVDTRNALSGVALPPRVRRYLLGRARSGTPAADDR